MRRKLLTLIVTAVLASLLSPTAGRADVRLPSVLNSHMVLQQGLPVPIWGWAEPGEKVTVTFAGHSQSTTADRQGNWRVRLKPLTPSAEGRSLTVKGKNTITLTDVLVGEVWLCSGQSNMEFPVRGTMNSAAEIAAAKFPQIRLFNVPGHISKAEPQSNCPGEWHLCSPSTISGFSAVGYFFGRRLYKELKVPVGLVGSNWGGTRIEPWTPPVGFDAVPELKHYATKLRQLNPATPEGKAYLNSYIDQVAQWTRQARQAVKNSQPLPNLPARLSTRDIGGATGIYNGMIHPLAPFALRGAIWYQGESNGNEGETYFQKMRALIAGWRSVFQNDSLAFYFVQLANFQRPTDNPAGGDGWAALREAQRKTLTVPHTGMAVIIDIGQANNIHPQDKQDVGSRLAQWALHQTYERQDLVPSGPLYKSHSIEGNRIRVLFHYTGQGLMVGHKQGLDPVTEDKATPLKRFAVAGKDKIWHWANARIEGDTVVVWSEDVPHPVAVRYAYSMNPEGANLYNRDGLPASPFRSDDW